MTSGTTAAPTGEGGLTVRGRLIPPRAVYAGLALLVFAGAAVLYAFDPRNPGAYPVCPFLALTGCYCPGCGTLRALHMLLHGDIRAALGYNLAAVLALPFILYSYATGAMRAFRAQAPPPVFVRPLLIWALLAAIMAFWALRNMPIAPLAGLAP